MIVDERSVADFLKNPKYQSKTRYAIRKQNPKTNEPFIGIPISANRFYFDIHKLDFYVLPPIIGARKFSKLSDILNRSEQKSYHAKHSSWLTNQVVYDGFKNAKKAFWIDGFLTFRDCEYLTYKILKHNENIRKRLVKRFPYVIIDECQDLSPIQLTIISQLFLDGLKIHLIGDLNQSIYKFREVNPQLIQNFVANGSLNPLKLTNCYRSNQKIVNVFNSIFNNKFYSKQNQRLPNCLYIIEYEENEIPRLINRYNQLVLDANNEANEEIIRIANSAIIVRGSSLLNKFKPYKTESNNPLTLLATSLQLWNNKEKNIEIIESSLKQFGRFISYVFYKNEGNSRNYYCPEKYTNSKWRLVLASLLNLTSKELYPFQTSNGVELSFGSWATKVRNYIPSLINSLPIKSFVDISSITLRVETGKGQALVSNLVTDYKSICNIRTTTIHEIKGETFDSVMVVSSLDRQSKGGHWKDWFNENPNNEDEYEYKRYGYVALSRPKHLLVLAMPYNNYERDFFTNLGFKIENLKQRSLF
jgi:DNA helicase-2/ATP-dependent DNA helicase PcrA